MKIFIFLVYYELTLTAGFPAAETESVHPLHLFQNHRVIFLLVGTVEARTTVIMVAICAILIMEIMGFAKTVSILGICNDCLFSRC